MIAKHHLWFSRAMLVIALFLEGYNELKSFS